MSVLFTIGAGVGLVIAFFGFHFAIEWQRRVTKRFADTFEDYELRPWPAWICPKCHRMISVTLERQTPVGLWPWNPSSCGFYSCECGKKWMVSHGT